MGIINEFCGQLFLVKFAKESHFNYNLPPLPFSLGCAHFWEPAKGRFRII